MKTGEVTELAKTCTETIIDYLKTCTGGGEAITVYSMSQVIAAIDGEVLLGLSKGITDELKIVLNEVLEDVSAEDLEGKINTGIEAGIEKALKVLQDKHELEKKQLVIEYDKKVLALETKIKELEKK